MTVEAWLLAATTAIAVVAVIIAAFAVRTVRKLAAQVSTPRRDEAPLPVPAEPDVYEPVSIARPLELEPKLVQGRVIVPPTRAQVVRTALGRPGVRVSVLAHGLAHALRAENRDRILALMRREYRHRRRERLRAGRQAVRSVRPTSAPSTDRLHNHLGAPPAGTLDAASGGVEARPVSLTDRMISS